MAGRESWETPEFASRTVRPVVISFSDLQVKESDLSEKVGEAFGPKGLGIVVIADVPGFSMLRQYLLHLSPRVASLPDDVKATIEDPGSRYTVGWNHKKEKLGFHMRDEFKGSFNANPFLDVPTTDMSLIRRYPMYCRPNKWPTSALPDLEVAFKALGKVMLDVGLMLAYHCDQYVSNAVKVHKGGQGLEQILERSRCHKGRLLCYLPKQKSDCARGCGYSSSWCTWHTDYSCLTGLTCGMFMRNGVKVECPDNAAGLYIQTRDEEIVKVDFGEDELAYQIGEAAEILSGGRLCATPHYVQAPSGEEAIGVVRSTFALFMQPDWDENLKLPEKVHQDREHPQLVPRGASTFGEYSEALLSRYI